jgi:4'-phosphopantetheinyl transferase
MKAPRTAPDTPRSEWEDAPEPLSFEPDEIHLWRAELLLPAREVEALRTLLDPGELERASRFRFPRDRNAFIAGRGILRELLSRYVGRPPGALAFTYGPEGKPQLPVDAACFNVAHSGGRALYVVARGREVGVDLEEIRSDSDWEQIASRFFTGSEVAALAALETAERELEFFRIWTRKEAYIKGRGRGLSIPLNRFSVLGSSSGRDGSRGEEETEFRRWELRDVDAGAGFAAAVAVRGEGWTLRRWRWRRG